MDQAQWGNLAEWAAVLAAVAIAIWSSWRAARAAKNADEAQDRSTRALELAAAAQERLAAIAEADAARYRRPWTVSQIGQHLYRLGNERDEAAYDVVIDGDYLLERPVHAARVDPYGAVNFHAARTGGGGSEDVAVHWFRQPNRGGDLEEWRFPLP